MIEYRLNEEGILVEVESNSVEQNNEISLDNVNTMNDSMLNGEVVLENNNLPVERGFWTKFKDFMFKEITFSNILPRVSFELELTSYEKKVFTEVRDFWTQDIRDIFKRN
mgnify:CR=1 FL=1